MRGFAAIGAALALLTFVPDVRAQSCPAAAERIGFVRRSLDRGAGRARTWTWGWGIGYGALTVAQLALVPAFDDPGLRVDLVVGGISTAAGLALLVALPLSVMRDSRALDRQVGSSCALVREAESTLGRDADDEAAGVGWPMHALNVALNLVAGLVLGLGFGRWPSGLATFLAGTALGEVTILTQPTDLGGALEDYRRNAFRP